MLTMLQMESKLDKGDDPSLNDKHMVLGDIVSRDTKAWHACGIPAPSCEQLKGLNEVRHYSGVEQSLILLRLLQPYHCGDIDVGTPKWTEPVSRSAATAVSARNSKSPLFESIKRSSVSHQHSAGNDAVEKDKQGLGKQMMQNLAGVLWRKLPARQTEKMSDLKANLRLGPNHF